jgi:phospholipase A1
LPGDWDYRLTGARLAHQSNGPSLSLSRSWNRVYVMGAGEKKLGAYSSITVQGRVWWRLRESSGNDDNPGIEDYIGRAEVAAHWQINKTNTLGVTIRRSRREDARGSARLDWMLAPASSPRCTSAALTTCNFSVATVTASWITTEGALC